MKGNKNKRKFYQKKRFWLLVVFIVIIGLSNNDSDTDTKIENETSQVIKETESEETDVYGWTVHDYEEFNVALKMIADNYLTNYRLPLYDKWQIVKFDDKGRIFAMTDECTLKDSNEKHLVVCVFSLSGEIKENGLHENVVTHFFGTDEKTYYDDSTCDTVFEKIKSLTE